jgi:L-iditol 2-dehydrogenase
VKVARLYGYDDIRIEEMPVPEVGPGEALIRTRASGICSGDVMPWYIEKKAPLVLGHEPTGEIFKLGEGVSSFKEGDRVFVHHHAPCFDCRHCARGNYAQCQTWRQSRIIPGGIAEYILVPRVNLEHDTFVLSDSVTFEDGTLVEPLACVLKGLKRASFRKGSTALVMGMGSMGALQVLALKNFGAEQVVAADMVPFRLKKALELGADGVIDLSGVIDPSSGGIDPSKEDTAGALRELTSGRMADLVVVGPGSIEAIKTGIYCAAPGGTVLMFTPVRPGDELSIDPNELYFKDINIVTSYSCGPTDTAEALVLIETGVVTAKELVTHRFPIEKTAEAYRLTAEAGDSLKCLIVFGEA